MHRSFYGYALAGRLALLAAFPIALFDAAARLVVAAFSWLAPPGPELELAGPFDRVAYVGGEPIDPALAHSLRHEAGVPRYAADRHV
jgi:hypothetical protein